MKPSVSFEDINDNADADRAVRVLNDELENAKLTNQFLQEKVTKLEQELADLKQHDVQEEHQVAQKSSALQRALHSNTKLKQDLQQANDLLREEDEAILYLQQRIEEQKQQAQAHHVKEALVRDAHKAHDNLKALHEVHDAIAECELLVHIEDIQGAKEQYTRVKQLYEGLHYHDKATHDRIVKVYKMIMKGMHHEL